MRLSRKALRTWGRKHPYLGAFIGYAVFMLIGTTGWLIYSDRDPLGAVFRSVTDSAIYWLVAVIYLRKAREQARRLNENGEMRAFLRYPDSLPGSLSGIWNPGVVTPTEGTLRFQPAVYESLEAVGRATNFTVADVSARWTITGKDRKYLPASAGYEAVTLATDKGRVELAAIPESLDLLAVIQSPIGQDDPGPRGH